MSVPESHRDFFEKRTFAHVTTLMPDGSPQATPVWVDYDPAADQILINTAEGRRKERNLRRDPTVALSMTDPDDPYRFLSVRGEAVELTDEGAVDHINELTRRYMDEAEYPYLDEESEPRVIVRIRPDDVVAGGG